MKMKFKLTSSLKTAILATMMVVGTAGCASTQTSSSPKQTNGSPNQMVMYSVNKSATYDTLLKPFEKEHNVKIQVITLDSASFVQKFMAVANANQQVDVVDLNGQDVRYFATSHLIQNLNNIVNYKDRFVQSSTDPFTFNSNLYALPNGSAATSGLYYNVGIFNKYHLTPPQTFQQLIDDAKVLQANNIIPIGFGGGSIYMWPMWFMQTFSQTTNNNAVQDSYATLQGKMKFTDPVYVEAMEDVKKMAPLFESGVNGVNSAGGEALFESGKAAMFYGGSWEIGTFMESKQYSSGQLNFSAVPFPLFKSMAISPATGGSGSALAIYSKIPPSHQKLAEELIDFMTTNQFQQQYMNQTKSLFSVNVGVKSTVNIPAAGIMGNQVKNTFTFLDWTWPPQVTTAFQQNIQGVIGGQVTPKQAMQNIQQTFDQLVSSGYQFK